MIVFGGSSSIHLAREVAGIMGCELGKFITKKFPDGERFVRIEDPVEGMDAVIVQSTSKPQDENLIELFLMADALKDLNAKVTTVIPYYGYSRQDKAFSKGEAVAARTFASHISLSSDRVITINPHKDHILDYFNVPSQSLDASILIGSHFKKYDLNDPMVIAPDAGSKKIAERVSNIIGCQCGNCEKKRLGPGKVITTAENITLKGNDVIIVDDIIDSGGTIIESAKALKSRGAGSVYVACVHPVLTGRAGERILSIADHLSTTNTIQTQYSNISVASLIAAALKSN